MQVDEDALELYALGRMPDADPEMLAHLERCEECRAKVQDTRDWAHAFKRAFAPIREQISCEKLTRAGTIAASGRRRSAELLSDRQIRFYGGD